MSKREPTKKMVTEAVRAAFLQQYMRENRAALEKATRAYALEVAIEKALKKHKVQLRHGDYLDKIGTKDACACAVGAAILARAETKEAAKRFNDKVDVGLVESPWGRMVHSNESRQEIMRWATKVVGEGITEEDLKQLEAGFEHTENVDLMVDPDPSSPFYQLGVKLAKKAAGKAWRA